MASRPPSHYMKTTHSQVFNNRVNTVTVYQTDGDFHGTRQLIQNTTGQILPPFRFWSEARHFITWILNNDTLAASDQMVLLPLPVVVLRDKKTSAESTMKALGIKEAANTVGGIFCFLVLNKEVRFSFKGRSKVDHVLQGQGTFCSLQQLSSIHCTSRACVMPLLFVKQSECVKHKFSLQQCYASSKMCYVNRNGVIKSARHDSGGGTAQQLLMREHFRQSLIDMKEAGFRVESTKAVIINYICI